MSLSTSLSRRFVGLAILTWVLIGFGALVRAKQAGLACPDWPLCFGEVVPDVRLDGVIYEFGHRVLAGVIALLYLWAGWSVWRHPEHRRAVGRVVLLGGAVLLVQIVMGGLTVLIVDRPVGAAARPAAWTVTTHLLLGNVFAAVTFLVGWRLRPGGERVAATPSAAFKPVAVLWSLSLLAQFLLGGNIAANLAGMVCIEFPTCSGGIWFPSWSGFVGLQLLHRLNGYLLVLLAGGLWWMSRGRPRVHAICRVMIVLVVLQVFAGALNIWLALPPSVTVVHSALASALFIATFVLWQRAVESPGRELQQEG